MTTIYTGDAQLISGGWERTNPYCEDCDIENYDEFEARSDGPATYVTLRIPDDTIRLSLADRYELTITTPEAGQ